MADADIERAWRMAERSRALADRRGDPVSSAQSDAALAVLGVTVGDTAAAAGEAARAVRSSRRQFDVFALRTVLRVLALRMLELDEPTRAAAALGWYDDLLERCSHRHSMAAADLAERAITTCREQLGPVDYARAAAAGAARSISELAEDVSAVG